jgi:zinc resistance-associated protein
MKRFITIGGMLLLVTALAMPVFARGPGCGMGGGGSGTNCPQYGGAGNQNLTDEQRKQLDTLYKKFHDDTAQLRNQLWTKKGELNTLLGSPNPDAAKAKAMQKELSDLQAKMAQERLTLQLEELKINPDARFGRGGLGGPHMRGRGMGMGMGMGPGSGMGGYGHGSCVR